jgi:hypothetical protein
MEKMLSFVWHSGNYFSGKISLLTVLLFFCLVVLPTFFTFFVAISK